jgi:hypothetical protein
MTFYMPRRLMILQNPQTKDNEKDRNAKDDNDTDT